MLHLSVRCYLELLILILSVRHSLEHLGCDSWQKLSPKITSLSLLCICLEQRWTIHFPKGQVRNCTNKLNPYWCPVSHVAPWGNELRNSDLKFVIEDHHICLHFNTMLPSRQLMMPSIWAGIPSHRVFSRGYPCSGWMVLCPFSMFSLNLQNSPPLNRYVLPLWAQMKAASTLFTVSPDFFFMPQSERGRG